MTRLAIIPSDSIDAYKRKGTASWLEDYYNPLHLFDEVYLLSPLEKKQRYEFGMNIMPTNPKQFKNCIKELNIDIVRAYGGYWACDMVCKNKVSGVPVVVSVHDTNPNLLYNSIKNADIVFCMSKAVKNLVLTKYKKKDRAWILQNRVDFDVMHPHPKEKVKDLDNKFPFKYKILHIGRKTRQKNLDTVMKALKILGDNYCLLAIGRGKKDEYIKLAQELEIKKQCYFIDSIPNEELPYYYSLVDCMCVPSRWEGFGVVFIEALACEVITITSDIAPMNEYIEHLKNGLLVKDYEEPKALADAIKTACNDKNLRELIKRNTRKSVERFEKRRIDKLETDYYRKILAMKKNNEFNISFWQEIFWKLESIVTTIIKIYNQAILAVKRRII